MSNKPKAYSTLKREKITRIVNEIDEIPAKDKPIFIKALTSFSFVYQNIIDADDEKQTKDGFMTLYADMFPIWKAAAKRMFVKERKRTAIVLSEEEYTDIIQEIFGVDTVLSYEYDGICIDYLDADGVCEGPDETEICEELAKYFGFKQVSSIHLDDCDKRGVWICYV